MYDVCEFFFSPLLHDFSSYFFGNFGWRKIKILLILWKKIMITIFFSPYVHYFCAFIIFFFWKNKSKKSSTWGKKNSCTYCENHIYIRWYLVKFRVCVPIQFIKKTPGFWSLGLIMSISCLYLILSIWF